jgi:adenosylcobinamide-GDP ribazoletransferase
MVDGPVIQEARAAAAAFSFLTRLPLPTHSREESWRADLARAPRYFPLVGAAIGAVTGASFYALSLVVPASVAAALALAIEALLTGAFHEDALADFCDAFGGGTTPEQVRAILKDSRIGSYGALGLGLGILVRWSALTALAPMLALLALIFAGALARFCAVAVMRFVPPAADRPSLAKDIGARPSIAALAIAMGFAFLAMAPAMLHSAYQAALAVLLTLLAVTRIAALMRRKVGGSVGDGLGAVAFCAQALALAAFGADL